MRPLENEVAVGQLKKGGGCLSARDRATLVSFWASRVIHVYALMFSLLLSFFSICYRSAVSFVPARKWREAYSEARLCLGWCFRFRCV